jgi:hypothetical protein
MNPDNDFQILKFELIGINLLYFLNRCVIIKLY